MRDFLKGYLTFKFKYPMAHSILSNICYMASIQIAGNIFSLNYTYYQTIECIIIEVKLIHHTVLGTEF